MAGGGELAIYAHSQNALDQYHLLADHLREVGKRAGDFAADFGAQEEAKLAGTLHDLGKCGTLFQRRLEGKEQGIDHWSPGAWFALLESNFQQIGLASALVIQGHHIGLQNVNKDALRQLNPASQVHPLDLRFSESSIEALKNYCTLNDIHPHIPPVSIYGGLRQDNASAMLDIRMLFSALVDADFLDTEAHFKPNLKKVSPSPLQAKKALEILLTHIAELNQKTEAAESVLKLRADLLDSCLKSAGEKSGTFTLSAPTGAGKTLAMLAFALKHASKYEIKRIIVVIPYLSIIEQTASTYREIFAPHLGDDYIMEHHSLSGTRDKTEKIQDETEGQAYYKSSSLAENWDAPIIVTTSVQMLESLFSNRPFACRKLHNLARSVILFDEVQTLPEKLIIPTLATLNRLASRYGASVVFSTATQPAFQHLNKEMAEYKEAAWQPQEIAKPQISLFDRLKRVKVDWPQLENQINWKQIAGEFKKNQSALCIVNLKRHAIELFRELEKFNPENLLHLSTSMCPAHRLAVIEKIRDLLKEKKSCWLVSTQCVEAGVDLDFSAVYRAFAPLDAIVQAAGRCNRNGKQEEGHLQVFIPLEPEDKSYPSPAYRQAAGITRLLLQKRGPEKMDIDNPELFLDYYQALYSLAEPQKLKSELRDAIKSQDFAETARQYRLMDKNSINILVPYDLEKYHGLSREADKLQKSWINKAQPYSVSLYRPQADDPIWQYLIPIGKEDYSKDWFIYQERFAKDYDSALGLLPPKTPPVWLE